ncbi:MAG: amino acid ABC transporter permease [Sediminispirochaetaceae bacterium]
MQPNNIVARLNRRYGHLPWFRRYEFLYSFLFLYTVYTLFFMPPRGSLSIAGAVEVVLTYLLYIAVLVIVQIDREKPIWLKNALALLLIVVFGWLFYRYSGARWSELNRYFFNFSIMTEGNFLSTAEGSNNWVLMFKGLWTAVKIFLYSLVFSTILALALAVIRNIVNDKLLNIFIDLYVDVFRAVPPIALLIVVYSSLPYSGIVLSPFATGVLTLTLIEGAYLCEVFRSGIDAIHKNQVESARSLGLTAWKAMRLVIIPQAVKIIIPPYTNRLIGLMKRTAECSVIAIAEILQTAQQLQSWYSNATPLIIGAGMYMLVLLPMTKLATIVERRRRSA